MTKHYSIAAKKRAKKAAQEFALAATPRRNAVGRTRAGQIRHERREDVQSTALNARARQMGADKADMAEPMLSEDAGRCLWVSCHPDEARRLWGHYVRMTAAEARYHRSLGKSIHAKAAKIEAMQERFETSADDAPPDLRSQEERDRAAASAWAQVRGDLGRLQSWQARAIQSVMRQTVNPMDGASPSYSGHLFVLAMQGLDGVH